MEAFAGQLPFLILMLVIFFFFIILPQQRRQRKEKKFCDDWGDEAEFQKLCRESVMKKATKKKVDNYVSVQVT